MFEISQTTRLQITQNLGQDLLLAEKNLGDQRQHG